MTAHTHRCSLCPADFPCEAEPCRPTSLLRCPGCEAALDSVDKLSRPLDVAEAVPFIQRSTRDAMLEHTTNQLWKLTSHLDRLAPYDPTATDGDTWLRIGMITGARDGWTGGPYRLPPDAPPGTSSLLYQFGHLIGSFTVMQIRNGQ